MTHSLVWMSTEEIIRKVPCSCIDGRTQGPRFSAAGGSFGLIIHTLAAENTLQRLPPGLPFEHIGPSGEESYP